METHNIALLIPILAIVMSLSIPLLAIFADYRKRKEIFTLHHQERMAAIEKGIELPPLPDAFFTEEEAGPKRLSPHRHLLIGLVWLFVGLAVLIAYWAEYWRNVTIFGLIPTGIGLACLIYYAVVGRKAAERIEAERKQSSVSESQLP